MKIMAALFVENFDIRQGAGGAARLDLGGVHFSLTAPTSFPLTLNPHLLVLAQCPEEEPGVAALEVLFMRDGEQVARNVQPLTVEPGKFGYNLVQAELEFGEPGTVEAHCRIGAGDAVVVPLTVLPAEP
ncbi:MAG TPA: hypothetical protein DEP69_00460, partial [Acidimicrobiaceae bacterium]|nr:hypothetical protein [Acidimicrobiaceae bacterium]